MLASDWMRFKRPAMGVHGPGNTIVRAATQGKSLEHLLEAGVKGLLASVAADRAGLWLAKEHHEAVVAGIVVEAIAGPMPEQWRHLDISTPFLRAALEGSEMLRVELNGADSMPGIGQLVGMRSAIWVPIRTRHSTIGLAMIAYARENAAVEMEVLRERIDEIALAVAHYRDQRRCELAAEEVRSHIQLSRAILCGVSVESILPQIANAARYYLQAEFVALCKAETPLILAEGWDGPQEWRSVLGQERFERMWHKVLRDGREVILAGEALEVELQSVPGPALPALDRVIAIPIEVCSQPAGVLIAGLHSSPDSSDDMARIESYALLAASALDRTMERSARAQLVDRFDQFIEESSECLVVLDECGRMRNASGAAKSFLRLESETEDAGVLEDFFSPAAREAFGEWWQYISRSDSQPCSSPEYTVVPFEAALTNGRFVRLHLRAAAPAFARDTHAPDRKKILWRVVHMEDRGFSKSAAGPEERAETELLGLMDSIDSGVLLLDTAGKIRIVSNRLAQIMELDGAHLSRLGTMDALVECLASRFSHPAETASHWREQARRGDQASWDELEMVRPSHKVIERFARPLLTAKGERLGWLEVYRDITGHRLSQSKLLQTEKMAALGQLVSGIVHELNNPLTSIQGYSQLLLSRRTSTDRVADVQRISQEAARAGGIVKNLLLFSRDSKPERRSVDLNDVVERTLALRAYQLKIENIVVERELDGDLPRTLADAAQLQQVILNLIVNAEQSIHKGEGNGRIGVRTKRLAEDRIALEISDDGPGIPREVVSRIFDPFFTTKPAGAGTGLGLSIVYSIVNEHGGKVRVESQPGHGATIIVELPALNLSALPFVQEESAVLRTVAAPMYRNSLRRERILVVEDEPTVAQLVADVLSESGHRVDILLDSRKALEQLKEKKYDLIICDLKMPHLDGPGFYRALVRAGNPLQHRLLFVTGDTMSPRTHEFLTSSGVPYLAKPFLVEELKQVVHQALGDSQEEGESIEGHEWSRAVLREK